MTENLTESLAIWPWAPWLLLAGLCFTIELFRRDHWAEVGLVGSLVAAAVAAVMGAFPLQFLAFAVGAALALALSQPWAPEEPAGADDAGR